MNTTQSPNVCVKYNLYIADMKPALSHLIELDITTMLHISLPSNGRGEPTFFLCLLICLNQFLAYPIFGP